MGGQFGRAVELASGAAQLQDEQVGAGGEGAADAPLGLLHLFAVESATVGPFSACRVAITGSAYITADSTIYVDRADELADGFQLA